MPRRSDIARRRWIGDVVDYAITCRTGTLADRVERGMLWVDCGVERGDTGIGLRTQAHIRKDWEAVSAEAEQRVREVYAQHGEAYHTGRHCSCAGCYQRDREGVAMNPHCGVDGCPGGPLHAHDPADWSTQTDPTT